MIFLNKLLLLSLLQKLFSEYDDMILLHSDALKELVDLLKNAGMESQFLAKLEEHLFNLKVYGSTVIGGKGSPMEHLQGESPLCSMRFPFTAANIRILFVYQNQTVYILSAFYERAGKRTTGYSAHIPTAKQRLDELLKEW